MYMHKYFVGGEEDYNSGSGFYFAGRNDDYNYGPYMVQFNAGEIHALLLVSINNDNILEGNETFYLAIDSSSLPNSVSVDNGGQTTVNILDDDSKCEVTCEFCGKHISVSYLEVSHSNYDSSRFMVISHMTKKVELTHEQL